MSFLHYHNNACVPFLLFSKDSCFWMYIIRSIVGHRRLSFGRVMIHCSPFLLRFSLTSVGSLLWFSANCSCMSFKYYVICQMNIFITLYSLGEQKWFPYLIGKWKRWKLSVMATFLYMLVYLSEIFFFHCLIDEYWLVKYSELLEKDIFSRAFRHSMLEEF